MKKHPCGLGWFGVFGVFGVFGGFSVGVEKSLKMVANEQPSLLRRLSMAETQSLDKKLHDGVVNSAKGVQ